MAPPQRLEKEEVDHWLALKARHICRLRHFDRFLSHTRNLIVDAGDVYYAKLYFARDTLSGANDLTSLEPNLGIDLIENVLPDVYRYLEDVWFRDVIELDAYFIWTTVLDRDQLSGGQYRKGTAEWQAAFLKHTFFEACAKYRTLLTNQGLKRSTDKFVSIQEYLTHKYLDENERLRPNVRDDIIRIKAEQMAKGGGADNRKNWEEAARCVDAFYNNIVPAVMRLDRESMARVWSAVLRSEGEYRYSRASIMNSFEAAVCIYFLRDVELVAADWNLYDEADGEVQHSRN